MATKPKRVLSNIAAEYIEVTAGHDIGSRTATIRSVDIFDEDGNIDGTSRVDSAGNNATGRIPEFVPELDRFVSLDETPK